MKKPNSKPNSITFMLAFLGPAMLVYTVFLFIPIIDSMRLSLYSGDGMVPEQFVGIQNYIKLFTKFPFKDRLLNAFVNNIQFFLIVTLIQNILGFFLAFLVTRDFKGRDFFRKIAFLPTTLSVLVVGFLFKLILNPVWGIFNKALETVGLEELIRPWLGDPQLALPILAIVVSWQFLGESVLFYTSGIDQIPDEQFESARIDGASAWQELRYIVVPSIIPIIAIVTILIFIGDFTQFDIVYAMTTSMGNPSYATDLFGSLFYRATFATPVRGGWGVGMGAAVSTVMTVTLAVGVGGALLIFNRIRKRYS